jgi:DNA-binding transcriptional ArsR family regulator
MSDLYLRFLRLARALNQNRSIVKNIDATAMLLLNEIAVQHFDAKTITVTEAMTLNNIASPATIHRKLDELREAGLIEQVFEGKNRRTKYLVPTKLANTYFEKMSEVMTNAVNH